MGGCRSTRAVFPFFLFFLSLQSSLAATYLIVLTPLLCFRTVILRLQYPWSLSAWNASFDRTSLFFFFCWRCVVIWSLLYSITHPLRDPSPQLWIDAAIRRGRTLRKISQKALVGSLVFRISCRACVYPAPHPVVFLLVYPHTCVWCRPGVYPGLQGTPFPLCVCFSGFDVSRVSMRVCVSVRLVWVFFFPLEVVRNVSWKRKPYHPLFSPPFFHPPPPPNVL